MRRFTVVGLVKTTAGATEFRVARVRAGVAVEAVRAAHRIVRAEGGRLLQAVTVEGWEGVKEFKPSTK